jgi:ParB family chromosome partitioning protein
MDMVEQFEAFRKLRDAGKTDEEVAADFFVTPTVVRQRLRLAAVAPPVLEAYRANAITLAQLMAYAGCDDHARQLEVFRSAGTWLDERELRNQLHDDEVDASATPLATLVGAEAFQAAGGVIRRDLFTPEGHPGFWSPAARLDALVTERLQPMVDQVRAEGWKWVEVEPVLDRFRAYQFHRTLTRALKASDEDLARAQAVGARIGEIDALLQSWYDQDSGEETESGEAGRCDSAAVTGAAGTPLTAERVQALEDERCRLEAEGEAIRERLQEFEPQALTFSGAVVGLDGTGEIAVRRGFMTTRDAAAWRSRDEASEPEDDGGDAEDPKTFTETRRSPPGYPSYVNRSLLEARSAALQTEVAASPQVAPAVAVHEMALDIFTTLDRGCGGRAIVHLTSHDKVATAGGSGRCAGREQMERERTKWLARLGAIEGPLLPALIRWPQDQVLALLAFCVAATIHECNDAGQCSPGSRAIAEAVSLDMHRWWTPSIAFFSQVRKSTARAVVDAHDPTRAQIAAKSKKADLARAAEAVAIQVGWLPPIFEGLDQLGPDSVATDPLQGG